MRIEEKIDKYLNEIKIGGKNKKPCSKYEPCQEPEEKSTVCYNCGFLRKEHKS